ncbi:uncharacterized protein APUU_61226A [Aspergillus puulaauensis]|uniref:Uncharacterized protein n=1 Tax=Aspergillus puulaauensis TaxID=1220207 RepID=A0A7R8ASR0_9EURO|nr:uncharacterized protein APUU_61226A [Aspergillus puulaauensis]BCS28178.1 hypothetical protein APUU_61226A [Aspergillus puulaauensis]
MHWLETQTGRKAEFETQDTTEQSSKEDQASAASTDTAPEPTMHVCIARKLQRRKEDGERRGVRIAGHLEWEKRLDSLREMTPLAEEVPAAVRALAALKEECDATYAMLELVRKCDPDRKSNS